MAARRRAPDEPRLPPRAPPPSAPRAPAPDPSLDDRPEIDRFTGRPFFRSFEETVADVSRGGARIRSREPLAPGRRVLLEIELPDGRGFEAIARVAWARLDIGTPSDETGLGIEFLGGSPEQMTRLERFLGAPAPSPLSA
jgi:hypothetical protein